MSKTELKILERRIDRLKKKVNYMGERHPAVIALFENLSDDELRDSWRSHEKKKELYDRLPESAYSWARKFAPIAENRFGHLTYDQWPDWALDAVVLNMRDLGKKG